MPTSLMPSASQLDTRVNVVATRIETALSQRTWSMLNQAGRPRFHAFLLLHGSASLIPGDTRRTDLTAPSLMWLPNTMGGEFRISAGGDGAMVSATENLVLRTMGDSAAGPQMRLLLDTVVIANSERIGPILPELTTLFSALARESREQKPGSAAMTALNLGLILLHLWRASGLAATTGVRGMGSTVFHRFRQLLELHYREGLSIEDYIKMLGCTRSHLHDSCLKASNQTPLDLIHDRIMEEAKLRLSQTDLTIEQIGYGLGFQDSGYFNRFFKRLAGETPGAYRKLHPANQTTREPSSFAAWP